MRRVVAGVVLICVLAFALADGRKVGELKLEGWVYASPVPGGISTIR